MKLSDIDDRCKKNNIQYAYRKFLSDIDPPHVIGTVIDTDNFGADNIVWHKSTNFRLELTTLKKDLNLEKKIECEILKDVFWNKTESYIPEEEIYNVSYFFNIEEE